METTILKLIELLETLAPQVWEALLRQVYIESIGMLVWSFVWGAIAFGLFKIGNVIRKSYMEDEYNSNEPEWEWAIATPAGFAYFLSLALTFVGIERFLEAIKWFTNPEFYAIRYLIDKLTGS